MRMRYYESIHRIHLTDRKSNTFSIRSSAHAPINRFKDEKER